MQYQNTQVFHNCAFLVLFSTAVSIDCGSLIRNPICSPSPLLGHFRSQTLSFEPHSRNLVMPLTDFLIRNESVPIQSAQCWFPGLAISSAKIKHTEAVLPNITRKLLWFEITKTLIAV